MSGIHRKCTPATQLYSASTGAVYQYYSSIVNWLQEAFDRAVRVLECRTSCRRQAQLVHSRSTFDSNEDFSIVEKDDLKPKISPVSSISQVAQKYGDELVHKLSDITSKLSTSTQPVPILPKSSRQDVSVPSQEKPAVAIEIKPSTSFKTRPPVPSPKPPPPLQVKPPPPPEDKPVAVAQDKVPQPAAVAQDKVPQPVAVAQDKVPQPVAVAQDKLPPLKIKSSSPPMTPTYDTSTVTNQSSMCSLAKSTPATSPKTSVPAEKQTISGEPKKAKDSKDKKPEDISESSSREDKINCSKCVEQGKTCIGGCPSADERRQK
uniref:Uncharacterized protein n=1 Tax=Heliothis virescens TaxID=7102 RepID=A0A2A4JJ44_HELVI